jgi:hypothetical protein
MSVLSAAVAAISININPGEFRALALILSQVDVDQIMTTEGFVELYGNNPAQFNRDLAGLVGPLDKLGIVNLSNFLLDPLHLNAKHPLLVPAAA